MILVYTAFTLLSSAHMGFTLLSSAHMGFTLLSSAHGLHCYPQPIWGLNCCPQHMVYIAVLSPWFTLLSLDMVYIAFFSPSLTMLSSAHALHCCLWPWFTLLSLAHGLHCSKLLSAAVLSPCVYIAVLCHGLPWEYGWYSHHFMWILIVNLPCANCMHIGYLLPESFIHEPHSYNTKRRSFFILSILFTKVNVVNMKWSKIFILTSDSSHSPTSPFGRSVRPYITARHWLEIIQQVHTSQSHDGSTYVHKIINYVISTDENTPSKLHTHTHFIH